MAQDKSLEELKMDADNLFREEIITDRKVGTIRIMHPIRPDGTADESRQRLYVGETQIVTPMGALPLAFQLDCETLSDAIEKFSEGGQAAVERAMKELQQLRREAASSIVIPEGMPSGLAGGGTGGGKIKLP
ncbi:MAG: hypothetical protein GTO41_18275 [Burkholderiales bacterium]|nr:hypothetical protein [Burkholderiales bacterium]